jgi:lipoprotein-releasing system permease protein
MLGLFEFSVAFKYLIPRKKHLSVTLIAMMSMAVISLVVWLLLVFLSVTEGMELNWLKKLTDLNAPLKIVPTKEYYSSYYYKIDSITGARGYTLKTLGEKRNLSGPVSYDPEEDPEIPSFWPQPSLTPSGSLLDPVKGLEEALLSLQKKYQDLSFQDYEMSGGLLKLQLLRSQAVSPSISGEESMSFLTQASYLATPPQEESLLKPLLMPVSARDLNHLFFLANYRMEKALEDGSPSLHSSSKELFQEKIQRLLPFTQIKTVKTIQEAFTLPLSLLPENSFFSVYVEEDKGFLPKKLLLKSSLANARIVRLGHNLQLIRGDDKLLLAPDTPLILDEPLVLQVKIDPAIAAKASRLQEIDLFVSGRLQNHEIQGTLPWKDILIDQFELSSSSVDGKTPPWVYKQDERHLNLPIGPEKEQGILLAKSFQDSGVLIGDRGFVSYSASTLGSIQEQRLPIFVAGFYDPGVISIGSKCLLVPHSMTRAINSANSSFTFDKIALNGFQVWFSQIAKAPLIKKELVETLKKNGLAPYWTVTSYGEYDFAKDLLQQFQSDKLLLSLIGTIILIVACSNIISFLVLLVGDKKKEIAILRAMGASTSSIACIFSFVGMIVGVLGALVGFFAAVFTLKNIDLLANALSSLQGHDAFLPAFYGSSLPNHLSAGAIWFIFLTAPILSLLSGLIPALKACKLSPSSILRSES